MAIKDEEAIKRREILCEKNRTQEIINTSKGRACTSQQKLDTKIKKMDKENTKIKHHQCRNKFHDTALVSNS